MECKIPKNLSLDGNLAVNWRRFYQQFEIFLLASGSYEKPDEVKIAILLNVAGEKLVDIYNTFTFDRRTKRTYDNVITLFKNHFEPKKNIIFERFKFYSCNQEPDQSIGEYVTKLRTLASSCEFSETENMVRDKLIIGINQLEIKEKLLHESDVTLEKAIDIAKKWVATKEQINEMFSATRELNTHSIVKKHADFSNRKQTTEGQDIQNKRTVQTKCELTYDCFKCGRNHSRRNCPAFNKICAFCKQKNHFKIGCKQYKISQREEKEEKPGNVDIHVCETNEGDEEKHFLDSVSCMLENETEWTQRIIVE
ncbi:uncharacterized protein LOC126909633, partial [Daktulosphaira vitifoliae]|uniref:uncharacterized protein LOC126909633 n=1 Tax=Daktulosphaira vitifoliae TaxID=58002 RepID=UPI0021AABB6F